MKSGSFPLGYVSGLAKDPDTLTVAVPSLPALQETAVVVVDSIMSVPGTKTSSVTEQPLVSVTITV